MPEALWFRVVCVAAAGAVGALLRWGSYAAVYRLFPSAWSSVWHVGTLAVNALGCFLFGLLFELMRHDFGSNHPMRALVFTGFLGAYTTYSTFAFDSYDLQIHRGLPVAMAYVGAQILIGWAALVAGLALGRQF